MLIPYNLIYNFIVNRCTSLKIDESHAVKHSLNVLKYSQKIFNIESKFYPELNNKEKIIYTSAMLHDMCDKKYMDEKKGLEDLGNFMRNIDYKKSEIDIILDIINTMSYSKVKKNGFPDLKEYQKSYNIVREADLLTGYDIERCMVYGLINEELDYYDSFKKAKKMYEVRMGKHIEDNLFTTKYGIMEAIRLDKENRIRLNELEEIIKKNYLI